jgi:hypothetical protein
MNIKIFCGVKYEDKEVAKEIGALWEIDSKGWYFEYDFEKFTLDSDCHTFYFKPYKIIIDKSDEVSEALRNKYLFMSYKVANKRHDKYIKNNNLSEVVRKPELKFIDYDSDDDETQRDEFKFIDCKSSDNTEELTDSEE